MFEFLDFSRVQRMQDELDLLRTSVSSLLFERELWIEDRQELEVRVRNLEGFRDGAVEDSRRNELEVHVAKKARESAIKAAAETGKVVLFPRRLAR